MKQTIQKLTRHQQADIVILLALTGLVIWYLLDAYNASSHFANLILILPISILVLVLCTVEFISQLKGLHEPPPGLDPIASMLPVIVLFIGFVLSLEWLGFDLGTALFIAAFLCLAYVVVFFRNAAVSHADVFLTDRLLAGNLPYEYE
jgi:hypothetical protein